MSRLPAGALAVLVCLASAPPALAHIRLDVPQNRYGDQKDGPCGSAQDARTDRVTVYEPGETITVQWEETINHPSHFRISFSENGTEDFQNPQDFDDYYTNDAVLLDEIPDADGQDVFEAEVTLPDVTCEDCTLQLIQVMYDKSYENAFYYQCGDLALREGGGGAPGPDGGAPGPDGGAPGPDAGAGGGGGGSADGGCGAGPGGGAGTAAFAALAVLGAVYVPRARSARGG